MPEVVVRFEVNDRDQFLRWLRFMTSSPFGSGTVIPAGEPVGYRADDMVQRREALQKFVDKMEEKLRKNDHKANWRDKPIEALFKLMLLEVEEFKVHHEFFTVAESRPELVDIANFALIVWDRLGMLDQERTAQEQK